MKASGMEPETVQLNQIEGGLSAVLGLHSIFSSPLILTGNWVGWPSGKSGFSRKLSSNDEEGQRRTLGNSLFSMPRRMQATIAPGLTSQADHFSVPTRVTLDAIALNSYIHRSLINRLDSGTRSERSNLSPFELSI